jgi:predicted small lipoprotein YifL
MMRTLILLVTAGILTGFAAACGIKRDLYLPDAPPPKQSDFPNKPLPSAPDANDLNPITPDDF